MRFHIELFCQNKEFPIEMRRVILSLIKTSLTNTADGKFYDRFYKDKNPINKDFCFSIVLPNGSKFKRDKIELSSNTVKVYFSTDDLSSTGLILLNSFLLLKNRRLPLENHNNYYIKNAAQSKTEEIKSCNVTFRTFQGSSILIRKHKRETNKDKYITVKDDNFNKELENIIKSQLSIAKFNKSDINNISVEHVENCRKVVVKNYGTLIDGTIGFFTISASARVNNYLYNVGLGSKHSQGFGMLNLVSQN